MLPVLFILDTHSFPDNAKPEPKEERKIQKFALPSKPLTDTRNFKTSDEGRRSADVQEDATATSIFLFG